MTIPPLSAEETAVLYESLTLDPRDTNDPAALKLRINRTYAIVASWMATCDAAISPSDPMTSEFLECFDAMREAVETTCPRWLREITLATVAGHYMNARRYFACWQRDMSDALDRPLALYEQLCGVGATRH